MDLIKYIYISYYAIQKFADSFLRLCSSLLFTKTINFKIKKESWPGAHERVFGAGICDVNPPLACPPSLGFPVT